MRNPIQLIRGAVGIFNSNPKLYIGIIALPLILELLVALFEPNQQTGVINPYEWVVYGLLALIMLVVSMLSGIALPLAFNNPALTVGSAYRQAKSFFWRYIGYTIVLGLILLAGFILLVIPGIILSVWFSFSGMVLVLENTGIIESLKRSRAYVRGKWWAVFGRTIVLGLTIAAIFIVLSTVLSLLSVSNMVEDSIVSIVGLLWAPLAVGYVYLMYQDAKAQQPMIVQ